MFAGSSARNIPLRHIIKDLVYRESGNSYLVQLIDVVVYFARQYFVPNSYIRRKAGQNYYGRLLPIINSNANHSALHHRIIQV